MTFWETPVTYGTVASWFVGVLIYQVLKFVVVRAWRYGR